MSVSGASPSAGNASSAAANSRLLVKLDHKSSRVKGLSFHPSRPWLLVSFYSGSTQIWDHKLKTLVDRYEGYHEGPVRTCAFHPSQPIFATGGDDSTIKVFNFQQKKLLFTLTGHTDYVRHVAFHHEAPWILSCADDQTVRIWNWQSRSNVAILTGHSHYVMCAQFHPRDDLVASASLDQTVRVWDISGVRRKHANPAGNTRRPYDDKNLAQIELFGTAEGTLKFILEHDRGVNWVAFHPSRSVLYSGSDDRTVKCWTLSSTQATNTDTLRNHNNNVSCVLVPPTQPNLLITNSEDKTLRVWDISRKSPHGILTNRREKDRFWMIAAHPRMNLLAAGHDSGFVVFKLQHERIPYVLHEETIFSLKDRKTLQSYNIRSGQSETVYMLEQAVTLPARLAFVPAEARFVLGSGDGFQVLPLDSKVKPIVGAGSEAAFLGRGRLVVLDRSGGARIVSTADCTTQKTLSLPLEGVTRILPCAVGVFALAAAKEVLFFDFAQERPLGSLRLDGIRQSAWSADGQFGALLSKKTVHIVQRSSIGDRSVTLLRSISEANAVKSAVWESGSRSLSSPLLFYNTASHLKFALPQFPDEGILCSVSEVLYLAHSTATRVTCLSRAAATVKIDYDASEPLFKRALRCGDLAEVYRIIDGGKLIGQSIIEYLRHVGHAEIAVKFVRDPVLRFNLALESGDLEVAMDAAAQLDSKPAWVRLAGEAMLQGSPLVAELAYRRAQDWPRLSFLHLITGNFEAMRALGRELSTQGMHSAAVANGVLLGEGPELTAALVAADQAVLAATLNKTLGNEAVAKRLAGPTVVRDGYLSSSECILRPHPVDRCTDAWPTTRPIQVSPALVSRPTAAVPTGDDWNSGDELAAELAAFERDQVVAEGEDELEAALREQEDLFAAEPGAAAAMTAPIYNEAPTALPEAEDVLLAWASSSDVPVRHAMARSQQTWELLLQNQAGVNVFAPLVPLYEQAANCAAFVLPSFNPLSYVRVVPPTPVPLWDLSFLSDLADEAHAQTTAGKQPVEAYRSVLHHALLSEVASADEQAQVVRLIDTCAAYVRALQLDAARRSEADPSRALELGLFYAAVAKDLLPEHRVQAVRAAATSLFKAKCYRSAGLLSRQLLQEVQQQSAAMDEPTRTNFEKLVALCDKSAAATGGIVRDAVSLPSSITSVCSATHKLAVNVVVCPVCRAPYDAAECSGVCRVCCLRQLDERSSGVTGLTLYHQ